ncbi:MAG: YafY family transcriptional regulator [Gammaproteobacteria bacterium]|nr:YafY family transcriptional regulator [Gammaproteobacteria bacterium]
MDRTERFYKIQRLLSQRRFVTREAFIDELEVSRATFKRDLEYLRDRMNMPIVWNRELGGYELDPDAATAHLFQLPGLWFSAEEVHALLTMEHLLEKLQPGLLGPQLRPLRNLIRKTLESGDFTVSEVNRRIRILQIGVRPVESTSFQAISTALLSRRQLNIKHYRRARDETLDREISPQRLVYYRDNWYLDAWCHLRKGLRTFSVDVIKDAMVTTKKAREVTDKMLDETLGAGFGIFSGKNVQMAVLRFSPVRARWVSREIWHSEQDGSFELDGAYLLKVPYSDPRELVMDVLKYGSDVEVLAPAELRKLVKQELDQTLAAYK